MRASTSAAWPRWSATPPSLAKKAASPTRSARTARARPSFRAACPRAEAISIAPKACIATNLSAALEQEADGQAPRRAVHRSRSPRPPRARRCLGFCQPDAEASSTGHCYAPCGLGNDCAWDATSRRFDGACYYQSSYEPASGVGDFGYCTPTCNCAADCNEALSECYNVTGGLLDTATHNGAGLCFVRDPQAVYPVVDRCE
jgi:hypothetical protein